MINRLIELLFVTVPMILIGWLLGRGQMNEKIKKLENEKADLDRRTKIQAARMAVRGRLDNVDDAELVRRVATTGSVGNISGPAKGTNDTRKK